MIPPSPPPKMLSPKPRAFVFKVGSGDPRGPWVSSRGSPARWKFGTKWTLMDLRVLGSKRWKCH